MSVLLISDLHLPAQPSPLREAFLRFLAGPAREARALYILGDLFEYWIGDDEGLRQYAPEVSALRALAERGVSVYFTHGNRDFLVGRRFARAAAAQLLPDPALLELEGVPTLLMHGDLLCTEDVRYQRWRRISHNRVFKTTFLTLPVRLRERIAGGVRSATTADMQSKPPDIMDVAEPAVREVFASTGAARLIHGHTHRPAEHRYEVGGSPRERVVLADWRPNHSEALQVDRSGYRRLPLD